MCAETVWWRCHRRIITDYLLAAGESVFHILGPSHMEEAHMTATALQTDSYLVYPAKQQRDIFEMSRRHPDSSGAGGTADPRWRHRQDRG